MTDLAQQSDIDEKIYEKAFLNGLTPEEILFVSEWSDRYRFLSSKASAESGRYRTDRTPYMRRIMEVMSSSHPSEEVVVMKSAQVGYSECLNNYIGYIIDHSPGPTLLVLPNIDMAKRNSKTRIDPLIQECPQLAEKVSQKKSRDSANSMFSKDFPGGVLVITGANSATGLRSMPVRFLLLDEVDGFKADVSGEGSPIELAKARTRTFSRRKVIQGSTPTVSGISPIEAAFLGSNMQYYFVPCPECSHMQKLELKGLHWEEGDELGAVYVCTECEAHIENWQKTKMLEAGEWRAEEPDVKIEGFHINSLYSPVGWYSWGELARDFVKAKKNQDKLKTFVNTVLGETWKDKAEVPDWNRLYARRESYKIGTVNDRICFLTAGVDVQKDRLELEIVGWCKDKVSYSIDYQVLRGDTSREDVWKELATSLNKTYPLTSDPRLAMGIKLMAVDSGYNTQTVYNWVRRQSQTRVIAIKGMERLNLLVGNPTPVDVTLKGKKLRRGLKLWPIGINVAKPELYGWLRQDVSVDGDEDPTGFCHFPQYGEDFFKMLTAEELVVKAVKGYRRTEWHKVRERNEALDCRVYARAAAAIVGLDRWDDEKMESMRTGFSPAESPPPERQEQTRAQVLTSEPQETTISEPVEPPKPRPPQKPKPRRVKRKRDSIW